MSAQPDAAHTSIGSACVFSMALTSSLIGVLLNLPIPIG